MALQLSNLVRIGTTFNRTLWLYSSTADTAAAIQGSGYFNAASLLLALDEVQCGVARTGKFLSGDHWNCKPDIVSLSKGIFTRRIRGCRITNF